jgi:catechol 2,3-dioxygenase-like lactoylglutathione lyase family enzyme
VGALRRGKAAVETLTYGLAQEVAREGIRVNAVSPGLVDTGFHAAAGMPDRARRIGPDVPLGRAGYPEEIAEAVVWLLSPAASFAVGTVLQVSGGAFTVVLVQYPDTERGIRDERRPGLDHVAFKVDSYAALKIWEQRLAEYGVTYHPAIASRTMPGAAVVVFCDPDGIQLEVWADVES